MKTKLAFVYPPILKPSRPWHVDVIGVLVAAVIGALAYLVIVYPAHRKRQHIESQAADRIQRHQRQRTLEGDVRRSLSELTQIRRFIIEANLQLEPESRLNTRIGALSELATRAGLAVDGIEPATRAHSPESGAQAMPIRLVGRGAFDQISAFLRSLHENMRDAPVTSLDLSAVPTTGGPAVAFTIELHWHTAGAPSSLSNYSQISP